MCGDGVRLVRAGGGGGAYGDTGGAWDVVTAFIRVPRARAMPQQRRDCRENDPEQGVGHPQDVPAQNRDRDRAGGPAAAMEGSHGGRAGGRGGAGGRRGKGCNESYV